LRNLQQKKGEKKGQTNYAVVGRRKKGRKSLKGEKKRKGEEGEGERTTLFRE